MSLSGGNCAKKEQACPDKKPKACPPKPKVCRRDIKPGSCVKRPVCKEQKCVRRTKMTNKKTKCVRRNKCQDENGVMNPRQQPVIPPQEPMVPAPQPEGSMAATLADMGIELVNEKIGCGGCGKSRSVSKKDEKKKSLQQSVVRKCGE